MTAAEAPTATPTNRQAQLWLARLRHLQSLRATHAAAPDAAYFDIQVRILTFLLARYAEAPDFAADPALDLAATPPSWETLRAARGKPARTGVQLRAALEHIAAENAPLHARRAQRVGPPLPTPSRPPWDRAARPYTDSPPTRGFPVIVMPENDDLVGVFASNCTRPDRRRDLVTIIDHHLRCGPEEAGRWADCILRARPVIMPTHSDDHAAQLAADLRAVGVWAKVHIPTYVPLRPAPPP